MDKFWKTKQLNKMTTDEWERLCDGCGKCCLHRVEKVSTGEFYNTDIACTLLNINTAICINYNDRHKYC